MSQTTIGARQGCIGYDDSDDGLSGDSDDGHPTKVTTDYQATVATGRPTKVTATYAATVTTRHPTTVTKGHRARDE